ncbi:hypothetical protein IAD21_02375 [Abditibacteriota bacterium]|nr:hypothetical protein IAD21_02375 [Abditibacteriota bacterium]
MNRCVIALFTRAPEWGKVKTRLAQTHGDEFAFDLAGAMLADTLTLCASIEVTTRLFLTPDGFDGRLVWSGTTSSQGEGDLWTRLLRADAHLRGEGFERVVFLGSDAPDVPARLVEAAFASLETRPLVVGPALDGGFYLMGGARRLPDDLFEGVPVSARDTLAHLTENLHRLSRERDFGFRTLSAWSDVDEEDDLKLLIERLRDTPDAASHCREVLEKYGLL